MSFFADFHIHSYLSRATSKRCNLEWLNYWAQLKGLAVVGTGDFTHPDWLNELQTKLEEAEPGLYRLKDEYHGATDPVPESCRRDVRFIITAEISNIYKRDGRCRKNHNVIFAPDIETAERIHGKLDRIGNVRSDGRPILGLDARDLLEVTLEASPRAFLVPAHIWTPWFSMLGSKSGFDTPEECFGDMVKHIFSVETGLSSDPPMNWRVSDLDGFTLMSNSDAHSPDKLARECNLFHCECNFPAIRDALETGDPTKYGGTIEFWPEEGKYHLDGHRKCQCRLHPRETRSNNGLCPVCGKPVTVGVLYRVEELADREAGGRPDSANEYQSLIGLTNILSELLDVGAKSKKVMNEYHRVLGRFGPELAVLRDCDPEELSAFSLPLLGEAVRRMRDGRVYTQGGYDGEFGVIRVFAPGEKEELAQPATLVRVEGEGEVSGFRCRVSGVGSKGQKVEELKSREVEKPEGGGLKGRRIEKSKSRTEAGMGKHGFDIDPASRVGDLPLFRECAMEDEYRIPSNSEEGGLNEAQMKAVECVRGTVIISAGPGTGKTRVLTQRIAQMVRAGAVHAEGILAVTFTNAAADEMRERLVRLVGDSARRMTICTFHALGLRILREDGESVGVPHDVQILDEASRAELLKELFAKRSARARRELANRISRHKQSPDKDAAQFTELERYERALQARRVLDFDDLILKTALLLSRDEDVRLRRQTAFTSISVDEFQDINHWQYEIVKLLSGTAPNLCVIGDPDQSIYGFRGANSGYFERIAEDYPDCTLVRLDKNYRSSGRIVQAADEFIASGGGACRLWTDADAGRRLVIYRAATEKAEAEFVAHSIEKLIGGTSFFSRDSARVEEGDEERDVSFSDIAVLYRLNAQSRPIEDALSRLGVPLQTVGASSPWAHGDNARCLDRLKETAARCASGKASEILTPVLEKCIHEMPTGRERDMLQAIAARAAASDETARPFVDKLLLSTSLDTYDADAERVTLMTLHAAKGKEFEVVFVVGCEDGLVPYAKAEDRDEERRLFYVGMTRAKTMLVCSHARRHWLFGETRKAVVSPFLEQLSEALTDHRHQQVKRKSRQLELGLEAMV